MMLDKVCGIYAIRNTLNGNVYVGSSINVEQRRRLHLTHLRRSIHCSKHLQNAWNKYGETVFEWRLLEQVCSTDLLLQREQHWIDLLRPAYNMTQTAARTGPMSDEQKAKIGAANSVALKGKVQSTETKNKRAAQLRGRKRGHVFTPEWREKQRQAHLGKPLSDETRTKLSASHKGVSKNEAHKQAQSEGMKRAWARRRALQDV